MMSTIYLFDIKFLFSLEYKLHEGRMLLFWLLTNLQPLEYVACWHSKANIKNILSKVSFFKAIFLLAVGSESKFF